MKKILLVPALFFLFSCSKTNSNSNYFELRMGNTNYLFDSVLAQLDTSYAVLKITAVNTKTHAHVNIMLMGNSADFTGTYLSMGDTSVHKRIYAFNFVYFTDKNNMQFVNAYNMTPFNPISFAITQQTKTSLSGNFSVLLVPQNTGGDTLVTGSFNSPIVY